MVSGSYARTSLPQAIISASYNAANQMVTYGGQTLTYDNNGNLTSDGINSYTWSPRNQLISITGPGLSSAFQYDAFGRRSSKTINGVSTSFLYDRSTPVEELSGATPTANLITGLGIDEFFVRSDSAGTRTFLTDALGNNIALSDSSGVVQTQYTFEPFGKSTVSGTASTNPYQFTSRENDGAGIFYYRARYYHPGLQRFIGEDPLQLGGGDVNLYAYVSNDPINSIDPDGTEIFDLRRDEHEECEGAEEIHFEEPGLGESFIPIWGSGKQAFHDFDTGHEWWGTFNVGMAASDVCMVTALGRGLLKGGIKFGSHTWGATRKWYGLTRPLAKGQPVHHWLIEQGSTCGKFVPEWLKNQPWNLMPMRNRIIHNAVHGKGPMKYNQFGRMWFGTPDWYKTGVLYGDSKAINALRKLCDCGQ